MQPGVTGNFHAAGGRRVLKIGWAETDRGALLNAERVVIRDAAFRVALQLVLLVLPDHSLDVEWRAALDGSPATTAVKHEMLALLNIVTGRCEGERN